MVQDVAKAPGSRAESAVPFRHRTQSVGRGTSVASRWLELPLYPAGLAIAVLCGVLVRGVAIARGPFPLNDGGLFFVMARELQRHGFAAPMFTAYNHEHIPFAYPPLGIMAAAALSSATGWNLFTVFRVLPAAVNVCSLMAFLLLARELLPSRTATWAAVCAFSLLPDGMDWFISGGGITRSFGQCFALLTLYSVLRLARDSLPKFIAPSIIFGSLTAVSHLEWTLYTITGAALIFLCLGRSVRNLLYLLVVGGAALAIALPWWAIVVNRYGMAALKSVFFGSSHIFPWYFGIGNLITLRIINEPSGAPVGIACALIGVATCVKRREWFLPVWLLATFLVEPRGAIERSVVPVALLDGIAFSAAVRALRSRVERTASPDVKAWISAGATLVPALVLGAVLLRNSFTDIRNFSVARPIPAHQRTTMAWIKAHTPATSRFLVITSAWWALDATSEWFPALTARTSVTTAQGSEWIPGAFARLLQADNVQWCAWKTSACVLRWSSQERIPFDYVYVTQPLMGRPGRDYTRRLRNSLSTDPRFRLVLSEPRGAIYERL